MDKCDYITEMLSSSLPKITMIVLLTIFSIQIKSQGMSHLEIGKHDESELILADLGYVHAVIFSQDGQRLFTLADRALWWRTGTDSILQAIPLNELSIDAFAMSPDYTKFLIGTLNNTAHLWDAVTGKLLSEFSTPTDLSPVWVGAAAFSPNGNQFIISTCCGEFKIFETNTNNLLHYFKVEWKEDHFYYPHSAGVTCTKFSADGMKVVTGSYDNTAKLWDIKTENLLNTFIGHKEGITSVDISGDGSKVVTGSYDSTAILWNISNSEMTRTFAGHSGRIKCVAFSSDGSKVLTGSDDKSIKLWDSNTGELLHTFTGHEGAITSMAISSDDEMVLSGSADGTVRLWKIPIELLNKKNTTYKNNNIMTTIVFKLGCLSFSIPGDNTVHNLQFSIFSISGKMLLHKSHVTKKQGSQQFVLPIRLSKGSYCLSVEYDSNTFSGMFIVN